MAYEEKAGEQEIHSRDGADSNSEELEDEGEALVKTSKPSASRRKTRDAKLQVPTLKITSPSPSNQSKGASDFDVKPCIKGGHVKQINLKRLSLFSDYVLSQ
jgi:Ser-tRNA(Ala) deacylase AlaX